MLWPLLSLSTSSSALLPFAQCAPPTLVSSLLLDHAELVSFSQSLHLLFPLLGTLFLQIFRCPKLFLHSGVCTNITSSGRSFLTILSEIVPTHRLLLQILLSVSFVCFISDPFPTFIWSLWTVEINPCKLHLPASRAN